NAGAGNTAWVGDYKGSPMLFAEREHHALALASSTPWLARSVGFVGVSDGWQELHAHKRLNHTYRNGPVSPQDRWEEQPGYAPFTIATEIPALLVAADLA